MSTKTLTSALSPVVIGEGKSKSTTYIATKVVGPVKDAAGNDVYTPSIVKYNAANGAGPIPIASRDPATGEITWNDNASDLIKANTEAFKKASNNQMLSMEKEFTTSSTEKTGFNKASGNGNKASGDGKTATNESKASPLDTLGEMFGGGGGGLGGVGEEGRNSYNKSLCYPTTLRRTQQDTLRISVLKYNPKKMSALGFAKRTSGKTIGAVTLPVPGGVQDGNKAGWGSGTMTPVQIATSDAVKKFLVKDGDAAAESLQTSIEAAKKNPTAVKTGLAAMFTENLTGASDILARTEGAVQNPNMELLFQGPQMRAFSFSWRLSPRDERESMTVMRIIRLFKQSMAPKTTKSQLFLKAPNTYKLEFVSPRGMRGTHRFLPKVKECALVDFGVNYTPDGSYMTYENSSMVSYEMTLSFQELEPIYNSDYTDLDSDRDQSIGY